MGSRSQLPDTAVMQSVGTNLIKVFLVEDSPPIRLRLATMLAKIDGVCVVGEADNAPSAIQGILRTRPHSVVLDIKLVAGSGIEVLRRVRPVEPTINFIVLTNNADEQYRKVCMAAGANHFLDKASEFEKVKALVSSFEHDREAKTGTE